MTRRCAARVVIGLGALCFAWSAGAAGDPRDLKVATSRGEMSMRLFPPGGGPPGDTTAAGGPPRPVVLFVSGEGGWRRFDERIAAAIADLGYWVGGVDAMDYFWEAQDDRDRLASDFRSFAAALARESGRRKDSPVLLCGFSFGADLAPWLAGSAGWDHRVKGMVMIAPDEIGSLEFRVLEILGFQPSDHTFSVAGALEQTTGIPAAFIHGEKDTGSAARGLHETAPSPRKLFVVPGADHHFGGHEPELRAALAGAISWIMESSGND